MGIGRREYVLGAPACMGLRGCGGVGDRCLRHRDDVNWRPIASFDLADRWGDAVDRIDNASGQYR